MVFEGHVRANSTRKNPRGGTTKKRKGKVSDFLAITGRAGSSARQKTVDPATPQ